MQYYLMQYYGKMEKSTRDSLRVTWQGMQYYLNAILRKNGKSTPDSARVQVTRQDMLSYSC